MVAQHAQPLASQRATSPTFRAVLWRTPKYLTRLWRVRYSGRMTQNQKDMAWLTLRLPAGEGAQLSQIARVLGYSRSELVRLMLRRAIKHADELPAKQTLHAVRAVSAA
mgnify:FL=1